MCLIQLNAHANIVMDYKMILYCLGCLVAIIFGGFCLFKILKEICEIKMSSDDGSIKATVVDVSILTTGDIRPILLYTVNGEKKKYIYHFYHRFKEFPIGKEVELKLSNISGLA